MELVNETTPTKRDRSGNPPVTQKFCCKVGYFNMGGGSMGLTPFWSQPMNYGFSRVRVDFTRESGRLPFGFTVFESIQMISGSGGST